MKRILSIVVFFCILATGYSQSQRLVLLEEFTSSTCGPCAGVNPTFHTWQLQNPDKFTSIYYHVNWPATGDPMNLANPQENGARVNYYGVTYVPESNLDGNYYNGSASSWTMTTVNNRYAMPSPVSVQVKHWLSAAQDSVYSTLLVTCTQDFTGTLVAHNVIIEKWIHFNSAPGSNGEKDFYNVMKKMLPGSSGTPMPSSMVTGDYVLLEGSWKFGTVYDKTQIASVGFVQNKNTKEIFNTANSSTNALVLPYNTDLQVLNILNVPAKTCKNKVSPIVKVRNNGNNLITSMTIKYSINNGAVNTFTWNGSLGSMEKANISLPEYPFDILPTNDLIVYTTSPNSVNDDYPKNDSLHFTFLNSPISTNEVKLIMRTDNAPQDISWDVKNSLGVAVANSAPYTLSNTLSTEFITLPKADCYTFTIYDAGGNGICCTNGTGVYEISSNGVIFKQGGQFGSSESSEFWMEAPVAVIEQPGTISLNIYPNPITGTAKVSFSLQGNSEVSLNLLTALGQPVSSKSLGILGAGSHETALDATNLTPGVYILQMKTESGVYSRKVSIIR
ncbi:MAG: T9SS type A sorting domain-containing protein [Bacteroidetes bacterium]|nr:T9SS type A sorting domain-containing protein [Bacteroidota bacterium]